MARSVPAAALAALIVAAAVPAVARPQTDYALQVVAAGVEGSLLTSHALETEIVLENSGVRPWGVGGGWFVAAHWLDAAGGVVSWEGPRTPVPARVGAGDRLRLVARLRTPDQSGDFRVVWDVVHEGELWVSERMVRPPEGQPVRVAPSHAFAFAGQLPRLVVAGQSLVRPVRLVNDGLTPWPAGDEISVSSHWFDLEGEPAQWEGPRTALAEPVPPGGTTAVELRIQVPSRPGRYLLQPDLVHEGVCWFSERDDTPAERALVVVLPRLPLAGLGWTVLVVVAGGVATRWSDRPWSAVLGLGWWIGMVPVKGLLVLLEAGVTPRWTAPLLAAGLAGGLGLALAWLAPPRRAALVWLSGLVVSLVMWADALHLRFFGDLPTAASLAAIGQLDEVVASIASLVAWRDLLFVTDLAPAAILALIAAAGGGSRRLTTLTLTVPAGVAAAVAVSLALDAGAVHRQVFRRTLLAAEISVVGSHVVDLSVAVRRAVAAATVSEREIQRATATFAATAPFRAGVGPWFGAAEGDNLVMVQVESLQEFVIGLEVGGEEVTPFLNRWAQTGLHFSRVTDQTALGRSSDAELTTQVSLLPPPSGVAAFRHADNDFTGLAEVLHRRGYRTVSAVAYDGAFWNRRLTHQAFGYARSLFVEAFDPGPVIGWGLNDRDFLAQMAERLGQLPRPFAAWLITLSLHHPFTGFPADLAEIDLGRWNGTPVGNYLQMMRYLDRSLAGFTAALEAADLGGSTVVVVWGDHDAGFDWESDVAALTGQPHSPAGWYRSQRVPLLVRVGRHPELAGHRQVPAGHLDLAPTVLGLLGVDPAPLAYLGRNLVGEPGAGPVPGDYGGWSTDELLYLAGGPRLEDGRCLDVETLDSFPVERCAAGQTAADELRWSSRLVLEHDLQVEVGRRLAPSP